MRETLLELESILDREIELYSSIEKNTFDKKEFLIKGEMEQIQKTDEQILIHSQNVENTIQIRKKINMKLGDEGLQLSDIVEKAYNIDRDVANRLKNRQNKINEKIKNIKSGNLVIAELLKHSLKVINGTIFSISKSLNKEISKLTSYNNTGHVESNRQISSIIKEA